jgi:hypothetical protein
MLTVDTETDEEFVAAWERLARICAGELLEDREARISQFKPEEEDG